MLAPSFNSHQNLHVSHALLDFIQKRLTCTAWSFNDRSSWTVRNAEAVSSSFVARDPCLRKTRRKTTVQFSFKVTQSLCCTTNSQWMILHLHMFYSKGQSQHKITSTHCRSVQRQPNIPCVDDLPPRVSVEDNVTVTPIELSVRLRSHRNSAAAFHTPDLGKQGNHWRLLRLILRLFTKCFTVLSLQCPFCSQVLLNRNREDSSQSR